MGKDTETTKRSRDRVIERRSRGGKEESGPAGGLNAGRGILGGIYEGIHRWIPGALRGEISGPISGA